MHEETLKTRILKIPITSIHLNKDLQYTGKKEPKPTKRPRGIIKISIHAKKDTELDKAMQQRKEYKQHTIRQLVLDLDNIKPNKSIRRALRQDIQVRKATKNDTEYILQEKEQIWKTKTKLNNMGGYMYKTGQARQHIQNMIENNITLIAMHNKEKIGFITIKLGKEPKYVTGSHKKGKLEPATKLFWKAIQTLKEQGYKTMTFGNAKENTGTTQYKLKWGAKWRTIHKYTKIKINL